MLNFRFCFSAIGIVSASLALAGAGELDPAHAETWPTVAPYEKTDIFAQIAQTDEAEIEFWQSVKNSNSSDELEAYLAAYPNGKFAVLAKIRLKKLNKSKPSSTEADSSREEDQKKTTTETPPSATPAKTYVEGIPGDRPATFVEVSNATGEQARKAGLTDGEGMGIYVVNAKIFGTAYRAGIRTGDIILAADDKPYSEIAEFVGYVTSLLYSDRVKFTVWRSHRVQHFVMPMGRLAGTALHYFNHGTKAERRQAAEHLASLYGSNALGKADNVKSREFAEEAHRLGSSSALYSVGLHYKRGTGGLKQDHQAAYNAFIEASAAGNRAAQFQVAYMNQFGEGRAVNAVLAKQFYEKAAAQGSSPAMSNLAIILLNGGDGVPKDPGRAFDLAQKSYNNGVKYSAFLLARFYGGEAKEFVPPDPNRELKYLDECAATLSVCNQYLGVKYFNGESVPADKSKAITYFRKAVELGDDHSRKILEQQKQTLYDPMEIQQLLARLGFLSGKVDGIIGSGTRRAIGSFHAAHGRTNESNRPSLKLVGQLRAAVRARFPEPKRTAAPAKPSKRLLWTPTAEAPPPAPGPAPPPAPAATGDADGIDLEDLEELQDID